MRRWRWSKRTGFIGLGSAQHRQQPRSYTARPSSRQASAAYSCRGRCDAYGTVSGCADVTPSLVRRPLPELLLVEGARDRGAHLLLPLARAAVGASFPRFRLLAL